MKATCPKCNGSKRIPVEASLKPYIDVIAGYDLETNTIECDNCGGQKMGLRATGEVPVRQNGEACWHEYVSERWGNCYRIYYCKHCPDYYDIDSSD